jgi:hypothetical protein
MQMWLIGWDTIYPFFKQTLIGRVLTTEGKILPIKIICYDL